MNELFWYLVIAFLDAAMWVLKPIHEWSAKQRYKLIEMLEALQK